MSTHPREGSATRYAARLLDALAAVGPRPSIPDESPAAAFARCGLLALTGPREGPPVPCPVPVANAADATLIAFETLAQVATGLRGSDLLAERAPLMGLQRNGAIAPGGACRLLTTSDGVVAVNLARDDDWTLVPAWLETDTATDWDTLAAALVTRGTEELVERARLLGLAVAADRAAPSVAAWFAAHEASGPLRAGARALPRRWRVVDLASLWAGPLCSRLLRLAGAEVVKIESTQRPDGGRLGSPAFFERLNAGKTVESIDFARRDGLERLRAHLETADVVIEASRPRALRQLGIDAEALVAARDGLTWISITGYGRDEPQAQWIAYGDDAGVAGGLSHALHAATGQRLFVGDAIADPLTGLHAALAAIASMTSGGSHLLSLPMRDVVAHVVQHA